MNSLANFVPLENKTISWTAASNSQAVQFTTTTKSVDGGDSFPTTLSITNNTTVAMFVRWAATSPTAVVADDYAVAPNQCVLVDIPKTAAYVAVIPESSVTGKVYLARGRGN